MTHKKRLTIAFSDEDLRNIEKIKVVLQTKQISKVISYCLDLISRSIIDEEK